MNVQEVTTLLKEYTGKTLIEWSEAHGYKPDTVRATIRRWNHRTHGHPGGIAAEIAIKLSVDIGKAITPVLKKHIKAIVAYEKELNNGTESRQTSD